jgi:hypothetical protein
MSSGSEPQVVEAFQAGRRIGFGIAGLALACVSFLSLLGAEKGILAILLGVLAVRGSQPDTPPRRMGVLAIVLGGVYLASWAILLLIFRERLMEFVHQLKQLG